MTPEIPTNHRLMAAMDATWPAAEFHTAGPWVLRRGDGGGQRVSSATTEDQSADLSAAEAGMRDWGQQPLFLVTPDQSVLDHRLAEAGYAV